MTAVPETKYQSYLSKSHAVLHPTVQYLISPKTGRVIGDKWVDPREVKVSMIKSTALSLNSSSSLLSTVQSYLSLSTLIIFGDGGG